MTTSTIALVTLGYALAAITVFRGMQADAEFEHLQRNNRLRENGPYGGKDKAGDVAISVFAAIVPPGWVAAALITGGFYALRHPEEWK